MFSGTFVNLIVCCATFGCFHLISHPGSRECEINVIALDHSTILIYFQDCYFSALVYDLIIVQSLSLVYYVFGEITLHFKLREI